MQGSIRQVILIGAGLILLIIFLWHKGCVRRHETTREKGGVAFVARQQHLRDTRPSRKKSLHTVKLAVYRWPSGLIRPQKPQRSITQQRPVDPFIQWNDVVLSGVWIDAEETCAWVKTGTGVLRFKPGDVYRGAVLQRIHNDEIVFEKDGIRHIVSLNELRINNQGQRRP